MVRLLLLMVPLAVLAGCRTENPDYCKNFPGTMSCPGKPMNGGGCGSDGDCTMPGFPACELTINQGTCEPCTSGNRTACPSDKPHCDKNQCAACVDDSDCADKGVCLPTGGCAEQSNIIHASATRGVITQCGTSDVPCTLPVALLNVTTSKNIIKLDDPAPAVYSQAGGFIVIKDVMIDARKAILQRPDAGPILLINMANPPKTVTLLEGTIQSATGISGNGIFCNNPITSLIVDNTTIVTTDSAIQSTDCALNLTRLQIHDSPARAIEVKNGSITLLRSSVYSNHGGGLHIDGSKFVVVGNAFMSNGDDNSTHPAIEIQAPSDSNNRLDFNTIAFNSAQDMTLAGISCTSMNFMGRNNIIWMNSSTPQVSGNCKYRYSDIGPDMVPSGSDSGNNTNGNPKLTGSTDPHIASDSAAHGTGDSTTPLEDVALKDIDGQLRMEPIDIGADQYYPSSKP